MKSSLMSIINHNHSFIFHKLLFDSCSTWRGNQPHKIKHSVQLYTDCNLKSILLRSIIKYFRRTAFTFSPLAPKFLCQFTHLRSDSESWDQMESKTHLPFNIWMRNGWIRSSQSLSNREFSLIDFLGNIYIFCHISCFISPILTFKNSFEIYRS